MEQVDPILLYNTREWLRRAKEDLDAAALVLTVPSPLIRTAVRFRYPGAPYEPDVEEAQESLGLAQEFVEVVLAKLPQGLLEESR